jgi:pimeloyl-ACP methyl ester carboxylesterase
LIFTRRCSGNEAGDEDEGVARLARILQVVSGLVKYCQLMRLEWCARLTLSVLVLSTAGCGGFFARRIAQAPNTYPSWLAPEAPVELAFGTQFLTNFPAHYKAVGPPPARLFYRVVDPADYRLVLSSTNWLEHGRRHFKFGLDAALPGRPNAWTPAPRGTVLLLHGYGVAQFTMAPWALRLAEEGWRCVLVDLRGHGKSTGRRIYFGVQEARDLSQLLDALTCDGQLASPVAVIGESYGAALALRWKTVEPRVGRVVAIAPYAELANAVLNICREYARLLPRLFVKAGLKQLPSLLGVEPGQLNTTSVLSGNPVDALFAVGTEDRITPLADVRKLYQEAAPGSELVVVPEATHESVTYYFKDLVPPVLAWLCGNGFALRIESDTASQNE